MSSVTSDPSDPRLTHGVDSEPVPQAEAYLVLSEEERAMGFIRPFRSSYKHVGLKAPVLMDLTEEQKERYGDFGYVGFEKYEGEDLPVTGRFWTQEMLDKVGKGCGGITTMSTPIAETYARDPLFYGATYCVQCSKHLSVEEFVWLDNGQRVGS